MAMSEARSLMARGMRVTLISGDAAPSGLALSKDLEIIAMDERPLLEVKPIQGAVRGIYNQRAARSLSAWIAQNDTPGTVYHLHNWSHILSPSIFAPLQKVRDRLVLTAHDYFIVCPNGGFLNYQTDQSCPLTPMSVACLTTNCDRRNYMHKLWRVARQAMRQSLFSITGEDPIVLSLHELMGPYLERGGVPRGAITVLRNPVRAFSHTRIEAERNDVLVFIGRMEREKGPDVAAEAARLAGVKLRLIGDGPMRPALEEQYPEFDFVGWQEHANIGALVGDARALIMPSRVPEPFGMAALEATWSGLPIVIAADALLAPEVVESGAGFAGDSHDVGGLAEHLKRLFTDDALTAQMSRNAFDHTRTFGNTPDQWADKLYSIMQSRLKTQAVSGVGSPAAALAKQPSHSPHTPVHR